MENASKALLMSAGILVGIGVLSLAVYLFGSFSSSTAEMEKQMELDAINNFNSKFLAYDGKDTLTIYDVYTVANLAEESNKNYQVYGEGLQPASFYIAVFLDNDTGQLKGLEDNTSTKLKKEEFTTDKYMVEVTENGQWFKRLKKYTCEVKINENTGRVNKVIFK